MNLTDLILNRRSCRKFTEELVSEADINALKQIALCAPTSKNCQSWEFVFVTDKSTIEAISKSKAQGAAFVQAAPLVVVVLGNTTKTDVWIEDTSIAATFIQLKAQELNLGTCWVQMRERGFDDGRKASNIIKALLNAPDELEVECVIAVGHKPFEKSPYELEKLPIEHLHDNKF